jgi:TPR repeat protein
MCTLALELKPMRLEEAQLWATLAARAGDAGSTVELDAALMLELGRLVEDVDPAAAEHWYARATETRQSDTATGVGPATHHPE